MAAVNMMPIAPTPSAPRVTTKYCHLHGSNNTHDGTECKKMGSPGFMIKGKAYFCDFAISSLQKNPPDFFLAKECARFYFSTSLINFYLWFPCSADTETIDHPVHIGVVCVCK